MRNCLLLCFLVSLIKTILLSTLVTFRTFIWKTGSFRKWSTTFYSFGLKQSGKLHDVGHKLLRFDIYKNIFKNTCPQSLWMKCDLKFWKVHLSRKRLEKTLCFFLGIERVPYRLQLQQTIGFWVFKICQQADWNRFGQQNILGPWVFSSAVKQVPDEPNQ